MIGALPYVEKEIVDEVVSSPQQFGLREIDDYKNYFFAENPCLGILLQKIDLRTEKVLEKNALWLASYVIHESIKQELWDEGMDIPLIRREGVNELVSKFASRDIREGLFDKINKENPYLAEGLVSLFRRYDSAIPEKLLQKLVVLVYEPIRMQFVSDEIEEGCNRGFWEERNN